MSVDPYEAGFDFAVHGSAEAGFTRRISKGRRRSQSENEFDKGVAVGKEVLAALGGTDGLRLVLEKTEPLKKKALVSFNHLLKQIKKAKFDTKTEEDRIRAIRLEPCAMCKNIAICKATALTCSVFRTYAATGWANPKGARVPDRPFCADDE